MTLDFTDAPVIYSYEEAAEREAYVNCYAHFIGITPARLVVMEPCPLLLYMFLRHDDYDYRRLEMTSRASLCIKDDDGRLIAIAFYGTTADAEAARLQYLYDNGVTNEEDFIL